MAEKKTKTKTKAPVRATTATTRTVVRASPMVAASRRSRRRRDGNGAYSPTKAGMAGGGLAFIEKQFGDLFNKLPPIMGSRYVAAAGILHMVRDKVPGGGRTVEAAAAIAGYQIVQSGKLSLSGDDEF